MWKNVPSDRPVKTIYLDNASTTYTRDEVFSSMLPYLSGVYGNPSSIHHKGREASDALEKARKNVAHALNILPTEIIFTSGGTEANNLALIGIARAHRNRKHILVSQIEHDSVLAPAQVLRDDGYEVEHIPVDTYGRVNVDDVISRVRNDTALVSVMYANNEIGTVEPVRELADALTAHFGDARPLFHTDACQAVGQLPVSPQELGVDLMTINSGKIYGPKGIGMLYVRNGVTIVPLTTGGTQERGRRAGTESVAGIVGFATALTLAVAEERETQKRLTSLRNNFISSIQMGDTTVILNGHPTERLPNNIHFSIPHIEGEALVLLLDTFGICASTGSACNAHNLLPSHVLRAIGGAEEHIHGSIRFSIGIHTTEDELIYTADALKKCIERLRSLSPLPLSL